MGDRDRWRRGTEPPSKPSMDRRVGTATEENLRKNEPLRELSRPSGRPWGVGSPGPGGGLTTLWEGSLSLFGCASKSMMALA